MDRIQQQQQQHLRTISKLHFLLLMTVVVLCNTTPAESLALTSRCRQSCRSSSSRSSSSTRSSRIRQQLRSCHNQGRLLYCHSFLGPGRILAKTTDTIHGDDNREYSLASSNRISSVSTRDQFVRSVVLFSATTATTISSPSSCSSATVVVSDTDTTSQLKNQPPTKNVCQSGQLVQESAIPGAYQSTCMNLPERTVPLRLLEKRMRSQRSDISSTSTSTTDSTITLKQQPPGSGSTGMTVWNSGLVLTRLLDAIVDQQQEQQQQQLWRFDDQDIIELGCGTGLVSIACHKLGARSVVATDGNPQVLELASDNVRRNVEKEDEVQQKMIEVQSLQWGLLNAMDYAESASLVVGADLTYNAGSWRALAETISTVLRPKGICIYLSLGHEGFNVNAEIDGFLQVAKSVGLQQTPNNELAGIDVSILLNSVVLPEESERKVIQQGGGARVVVLERKMYG